MERQLVQKRVRRGVVRLTRVPHHPGKTREQDEEIKVSFERRPVELPRAQHLRPEDLLEPFPILVHERAVGERPRAVDHAPERRQFRLRTDPGDEGFHRRSIGDVRDLHTHREPAGAQPSDLPLGIRVRRPPAVQYHGPRAPFREPSRDPQPEAAEAARHQITAVVADSPPVRRRGARPPVATHEPRQAPPPTAVCDLRFAIRRPQLAEEILQRVRNRGVQIHEAYPQTFQLPRRDPAESPDRRPRQLAARFILQHLTASRHEANPRTRRLPRVIEPLRQGKRA